MTEEIGWKKFLTEKVLKEIWHESDGAYLGQKCVCGRECGWSRETLDEHIKRKNRTFDNRNDLMDLYETINNNEKWAVFTVYSNNAWWRNHGKHYNIMEELMADYNSWLFCFGNEEYEDRCKLICEFYGYQEGLS